MNEVARYAALKIGPAVVFYLTGWMLWNLTHGVGQRALVVGSYATLIGLVALKPAGMTLWAWAKRAFGYVLLAVGVLLLALGGVLQFAVPAAVQQVQQVQVDTTERVKDSLVPSWWPRSRA